MSEPSIRIPAVAKAAKLVGGVTRLAAILSETNQISRVAIYHWTRVPAERVLAIEAATNRQVTRNDLRPDLYPIEDVA